MIHNIGLPKSDKPEPERDREDRRLVGTALALAKERRLHFPALNNDPPEFCVALYDLQVLFPTLALNSLPTKRANSAEVPFVSLASAALSG